jgi:hypothetical protein
MATKCYRFVTILYFFRYFLRFFICPSWMKEEKELVYFHLSEIHKGDKILYHSLFCKSRT